MKTTFLIFLLAVICSCSRTGFNNDFLTFELRIAQDNPDPNYKEMVLYNSDQKFFVSDSVYLNNDHIASTEIIDWDKHPKVRVILNDDGRQKFAEFTEKNIGKMAAVIVDNKLISAPRINGPIREGQLIIAGLFNHEEALNISDGILTKDQP